MPKLSNYISTIGFVSFDFMRAVIFSVSVLPFCFGHLLVRLLSTRITTRMVVLAVSFKTFVMCAYTFFFLHDPRYGMAWRASRLGFSVS